MLNTASALRSDTGNDGANALSTHTLLPHLFSPTLSPPLSVSLLLSLFLMSPSLHFYRSSLSPLYSFLLLSPTLSSCLSHLLPTPSPSLSLFNHFSTRPLPFSFWLWLASPKAKQRFIFSWFC